VKPRDENKISQIYKATLKLVKENGLAGTTMQAVAKEADIATGTLYIYFNNKEDLVVNLFNECIKRSAGIFFRNYNTKAPFKVGFHTIWSNILQHRLLHFEESTFLEQCFHSRFIDETTRNSAKKIFDPLRELLERGKKEQLIKNIDTFWLITFMVGYINEIVKRVIYFNKKLTSEILELNFKLCWDGIKS
jgi:AcrR family transcriptional regulator